MTKKTAISPTRSEDFAQWYQQVTKAADLAEHAPVRGCMVIKPWGYGIWELLQQQLDQRIKETGVVNAYFPLLIPLEFFQKEAAHVEGFAKECAVVTHHRLEEQDGVLRPAGELEEPLIVRPTSETIIGHSLARWIESYRDLPLCVNQWANVVRWEMRTRLFLRTTEFLWQEGHTAHATKEEAEERAKQMIELYRSFCEEVLALPVIAGEKSPGERFPGADTTYTIEAMMQDLKAIQGGTSHYLGQNFSKASGIQFTDRDEQLKYAYTTSWGTTTRLVGGVIMAHGDDDGVRLPPRIAPHQVVILPVIPKEELSGEILRACEALKKELSSVRCYVDLRERRGGEKNWEWIKKGVPLRVEIGPRDLEKGVVTFYRRSRGHKERETCRREEFAAKVPSMLEEIQEEYLVQAKRYREEHTYTNISSFEEMREFFAKSPGGFVRGKWCEDPQSEALLEETKVTIRCLPLEQSGGEGRCLLTGRPATRDAIFAKAY